MSSTLATNKFAGKIIMPLLLLAQHADNILFNIEPRRTKLIFIWLEIMQLLKLLVKWFLLT